MRKCIGSVRQIEREVAQLKRDIDAAIVCVLLNELRTFIPNRRAAGHILTVAYCSHWGNLAVAPQAGCDQLWT